MRAELWNNIQRVLPNEIQREQLKPGDHIYTWRDANTKHHGIYISDEKVIHFTEGAWSDSTCPKCGNQSSFHAVVYSCIDCFLTGGYLHLFEYSLNAALFLAKLLNGTCTLASSDTPEVVQNRASFLLSNGSADYYSYINNSEDFAIYCKTGLLVIDNIDFSRRFLQTAFFLAITAAVYQQQLIPDTVFCGILGRFFGLHCISRFASDIRVRPNVIKVDQALNLPQIDDILASGPDWAFQRKVQSIVDKFLVLLILAFALRLWSDPVQVWSDTLEVVWSLPYITSFYWAVLQKRLLSNKIQKEQLKPGDHIYTWKRAYTYAHHGGPFLLLHLLLFFF
ncbi:protein LEAD-SENSITIVE 1-like [Ziziphus jujuba]|uniref:Protein LEAD-SENSITIVE 1-like n=1 Tax=Ziziphus jujuba TaxID=326968 RepID=A0ABM3IHA8_ZIZJJ|nr:protein LEAD-SENSITIVE 1-like [Ziziphus jujuba]